MELKKDYDTANRSLLRGIEILRCFKPGMGLLGNGEISERTGLPASTVSRLTQTLVQAGFLERDSQQAAYRWAPPVLSLARAFKTASTALAVAEPLMRTVSESLKLNVGLAVADRLEMVYLESIRYTRSVALRTVASGQRVPIERTSLGQAWIAHLDPRSRAELLAALRRQKLKNWIHIENEISNAIQSVANKGYCTASWLPEVSAISTPVRLLNGVRASLNLSTSPDRMLKDGIEIYASDLLELKHKIETTLHRD